MSLRKCACIDTLYTELPWQERFQAAKEDGFAAVEFWDWRDKDLKDTKEAAESAEILISGFNGDADYSLVDPEHREKYLEELKKSIEAAKKVGAFSLTIHSNALGEGGLEYFSGPCGEFSEYYQDGGRDLPADCFPKTEDFI